MTEAGATAVVEGRLDELVLARGAGKGGGAGTLASVLRPFAPVALDDSGWRQAVESSLARLRAAGRLDGPVEPLGAARGTTWSAVRIRILPGLALGIEARETATQRRLDGHDAWAAAVVARARGLWRTGAPPSAPALADAVVREALGLTGKAKRSPDEVRGYFLGQLVGQGGGTASRLLRHLAAREAGALRPGLDGLREALGRRWLAGAALGAVAPVAEPATLAEFATAVLDAPEVGARDIALGAAKTRR